MKRYEQLFEARRERRPRKDFDLTQHGDKFKSASNKDMNDEVYKLRREVMNYIYRARKLVNNDLPRVDVRITNNHTADEITGNRVLGAASRGDNIIWIPEEAIYNDSINLHELVYHELVHAIFGFGHDKSDLMKPTHSGGNKLKPKWLDEAFVYYYNKWKN